jgi:hypothetical protein
MPAMSGKQWDSAQWDQFGWDNSPEELALAKRRLEQKQQAANGETKQDTGK